MSREGLARRSLAPSAVAATALVFGWGSAARPEAPPAAPAFRFTDVTAASGITS